jgi:hypothetical protein
MPLFQLLLGGLWLTSLAALIAAFVAVRFAFLEEERSPGGKLEEAGTRNPADSGPTGSSSAS